MLINSILIRKATRSSRQRNTPHIHNDKELILIRNPNTENTTREAKETSSHHRRISWSWSNATLPFAKANIRRRGSSSRGNPGKSILRLQISYYFRMKRAKIANGDVVKEGHIPAPIYFPGVVIISGCVRRDDLRLNYFANVEYRLEICERKSPFRRSL